MALSSRISRAQGILEEDDSSSTSRISSGRLSRGKRSSSGGLDPATLEGLEEIARRADVEVPPKPESQGPSILQRISDILSTGGFAVGGLLSGKGPIEGIKQKISPSKALGVEGMVKVGPIDVGSLAADILLDPTTYLTFGTGGAAKATLKGGTQVALTKAGTAAVKNTVAKVAVKTAGELARTGVVRNVDDLTRELVEQGLRGEGAIADELLPILTKPGMTDLGGIKLGGISLVTDNVIEKAARRPFRAVVDGMRNTPAGADFVSGVESFGNAVGKLFYRDYGLPKAAVREKQKYLDILNAQTERRIFEGATIGKGLSEADGKLIMAAREARSIDNLPEYLKEPAQQFIDALDNQGLQLQQRGLINMLDDYTPHLYKDSPDKVKKAITKWRLAMVGKKRGFQYERSIPTLAEAEKLGLTPDYNIARVYSKYMFSSDKALLEDQLLDNIGKLYPQDIPSELIRDAGDTLVDYKVGERVVRMPLAVADDFKRLGKKAIDDEALNPILRGYDKLLNFWKNTQTSIFPAFHGRNFISNVANNALDIGVQSANPVAHKQVIDIMRGAKGSFTDAFGVTHTYDSIRELAKTKGVITASFGEMDIQRNVGEQLREQLSKLSTYNPLRIGRKVGQTVENEARLVNFITNLKRGLSPDDAADKVKKFLFDYDNLSNVEKEVFRRFIPFYTFSRKNIELQLQTLLKTPGIVGAETKALTSAANDLTEEEKQALPDWIKNKVQIVVGRGEKGPRILYGTGLPIEEAIEKLFPTEGGHVRSIINQSSFVSKVLLERSFGFDTFSQRPINELTSAPELQAFDSVGMLPDALKELLDYKVLPSGKAIANPDWLHLMRSVPGSRLSSTFEKMADSDKPNGEKMLEFVSGLKVYAMDTQGALTGKEFDRIKEIATALERARIIGTIRYVRKDQKAALRQNK